MRSSDIIFIVYIYLSTDNYLGIIDNDKNFFDNIFSICILRNHIAFRISSNHI